MARYIPARGDIVWMNFNPTRGREQKGARPAVVISTSDFNAYGIAFVVPVTSKEKGYSIEVPIRSEKIRGAALVSHMRSIDWRDRSVTFIEKCPDEALSHIQGKISAIITQ